MSLSRKSLAVSVVVFAAALGFAPAASATIHPLVESFDCANQTAFAHHPIGDVADPPGVTPGYGSHSDKSTLRSVMAVLGNNPSSPAAFGHKLDGECGHAGP
ncbi:hypothetical protein D7Z96_05710 [Pseudarthrobacter phenanthrenivorans]|uniref:Uncharacterized protein n=1 Tax=Pseudarthrobacter phenanthrenivorans TaxID=361575 RepID=A0A3B0FZF2_PSEPS|nr:hypothetical protein [Pseudarthrobacter phenanthrenivorans]RKO25310.1 hypothetical protein D7Z96_05710 [Pseudarthrobacter phenanthrenivorans]